MDGLEAVEMNIKDVLQNKDIRVDSNFWTANIYKNPNLTYAKIKNILKNSQYGISIAMNEDGVGTSIYRMNEIHNMLCSRNISKCAELTPTDLEIFRLNNKDVLFNRTNSYEWVGRTGIYYENSAQQFIFASYLVRFVPNIDLILPEYLTAFLSSKHGVKAVKSRARQSINQTNVNPEEVKEIEIPLLSFSLQKSIANNFIFANKNIIKSEHIYSEAEALLLSHLNLFHYTPNPSGITQKSFKSSFSVSGRLDSEYYQLKYDELENILESKETVATLCTLHNKAFIPNEKENYRYIELANIGKSGEISNVGNFIGTDLPTRARRIVKKGQVIVSSIEGSLESCALIDEYYDNALCSTAFYVISSQKINSETLLVLFKSPVIQALMKKRCSGTILTAINKDEFLSMPLPYIGEDTQREISEKIQKSFALRKQSGELLELAKKAVEVAIEEGEDVAIKILNKKGIH